jgi:hypothetical protein
MWLVVFNVAIFTILGSKLDQGTVDFGPEVTGQFFNVPVNSLSMEKVFAPLLFFNGLIIVFLALHFQVRSSKQRASKKQRA